MVPSAILLFVCESNNLMAAIINIKFSHSLQLLSVGNLRLPSKENKPSVIVHLCYFWYLPVLLGENRFMVLIYQGTGYSYVITLTKTVYTNKYSMPRYPSLRVPSALSKFACITIDLRSADVNRMHKWRCKAGRKLEHSLADKDRDSSDRSSNGGMQERASAYLRPYTGKSNI